MSPIGEKRARARDAAVIALQGAGGSLRAVVFQKALFYSELLALRDLGRPIIDTTFMAIQMGPVVANAHRKLIPDMDGAGLAQQTEHGKMKPLRLTDVGWHYTSTLIDDPEVEILKRVGRDLADVTSDFISKVSHANPGWDLAWRTGQGAGLPPQPINMLLALQDPILLGDDADDDDLPGELGMFEQAETGKFVPWE